jgi:hypothetical protein
MPECLCLQAVLPIGQWLKRTRKPPVACAGSPSKSSVVCKTHTSVSMPTSKYAVVVAAAAIACSRSGTAYTQVELKPLLSSAFANMVLPQSRSTLNAAD